jgi:hypothetical protein
MSEYDLTGIFPEEFEHTELPGFSDEEIEAFNRNSRDIEIEAGSLALAHSSEDELDKEIAQMLGERAISPVLLEAIESLEDEWGPAMAMLDKPTNPLTPPDDDPPDIAVRVPIPA